MARLALSDGQRSGGGIYEIVRLLPASETGEPAYRVKSTDGERAVLEHEIALV
jgi:hypothetical protein